MELGNKKSQLTGKVGWLLAYCTLNIIKQINKIELPTWHLKAVRNELMNRMRF